VLWLFVVLNYALRKDRRALFHGNVQFWSLYSRFYAVHLLVEEFAARLRALF